MVQRSLALQAIGLDDANRNEGPSYRGAARETITLEAHFEATPARTDDARSNGVLPYMAALELLLSPPSRDETALDAMLDQGKRGLVNSALPNIILEWGQRAVPVRLTAISVTEEMFDYNLNPVRSTMTLSFSVVTWSSVADTSSDAEKFRAYQNLLETLAKSARTSSST